MQPAEMERLRLRRHLFLARFFKQSVLQWEGVDSRVVKRYVEEGAAFLAEERQAAKRAMAEIEAERVQE